MPRKYTLTHSDLTGHLFLTIGPEYDQRQISGIYTRLMRDEILGEWMEGSEGHILAIRAHVSGGMVLGTARMRFSIFEREMPLALSAIAHGDLSFLKGHAELLGSRIEIHYISRDPRFDLVRDLGSVREFLQEK